jgi:hypothetical protein
VLTVESLKSQGIHELILNPFTPQTIAEALRRVLADGTDGGTSN